MYSSILLKGCLTGFSSITFLLALIIDATNGPTNSGTFFANVTRNIVVIWFCRTKKQSTIVELGTRHRLRVENELLM